MEKFELLARAKKGQDLIVRDDQFEYNSILDAAKSCREQGHRLSLVDSGKLTAYELEWLGEAGADLYTSDRTRSDEREITLVNQACRKGGAVVAYLDFVLSKILIARCPSRASRRCGTLALASGENQRRPRGRRRR